MQVKKFEARTMKDALEMVKTQLGPDAIILSARDNKKGYGINGEGSVEITAAISDSSLQKKAFTESRMGQNDRENFQRHGAKAQKQIINKFVDNQLNKSQVAVPKGNRRYIDIADEEMAPGRGVNIENILRDNSARIHMDDVKHALQNNAQRMQTGQSAQPMSAAPAQTQQQQTRQSQSASTEQFSSLQTEISALKNVIEQFQKVPQQMGSSYPGADYGIHHDFSFLFEKLTDEGMEEEYAAELLLQTQKKIPATKYKNKALLEGWLARQILDETKVSAGGFESKIHLFLGPTGAGKTSTIIKMASHLIIREKKRVALVTCDTTKVGAPEQMKTYAQILNVPSATVRNSQEWAQIARHLNGVDYLLVDYPGMNLKNPEEGENLKKILPSSLLDAWTHLVLPVVSKDAELSELGQRFKDFKFNDVIFTHLDESIHNGTLFNFMKKFNCPIHAFGIGSQVPEDFEFATKERVLDLILKITQKSRDIGL
ncbi:MAG: flagellar biosynthesis protein FlhF [Bdellovibrionota bacterium]